MKSSKFFLAGTTLLLAIAGVAATKGSTRFASTYYYQTAGSAKTCITVTGTPCTVGTTTCTYNGTNRPTYQSKNITSHACQTLLKFTPQP